MRKNRYPIGLDVSPQDNPSWWFFPEMIDPRVAFSERNRDDMIEARREVGLPNWPDQPLYPDFPIMFEPPQTVSKAS